MAGLLVAATGEDATEEFNDIGHTAAAKELMESYLIGYLADEESRDETASAVDNADTPHRMPDLILPANDREDTKSKIIAIVGSYFEVLERLVHGPGPVDVTSDAAKDALFFAAKNGHVEILSLLLSLAVDPYIKNSNGDTPLVLASANGHLTIILELISHGANINFSGYGVKRHLPLRSAALNGHYYCVMALLDHGSEVDEEYYDGTTALIAAAMGGHWRCVKLLVKREADVNYKDGLVMYQACQYGRIKIAKYLFNHGADISLGSPLLGAVGHLDCCQWLLDNGADVNEVEEKTSYTPLINLCRYDPNECVDDEVPIEKERIQLLPCLKLLLARGADFRAKDKTGRSGLSHAVEKGHSDLVQELLKYDVDVDESEEGMYNWTPCMYAAFTDKVECLRLLLDAKAKVNAVDSKGATALIIAARYLHPKCLEMLLEAGADMQVRCDNKRALDFIVKKKDQECIKVMSDFLKKSISEYYGYSKSIMDGKQERKEKEEESSTCIICIERPIIAAFVHAKEKE